MSTFSRATPRPVGQFTSQGRTKTPIQVGASGIDNNLQPKLRAARYNLTHTFSGLTPGVSVVLIDKLFSVESNGSWLSHIVRTGEVDSYGKITFDSLRDSSYSLLVVDLDYTDQSIHNISIGDPTRFDSVASHAIPSQPYIFNTEYVDLGTTARTTLYWRLGADGINGLPEVYYTISGTDQWVLFNRFEDESIYSAHVQPLEYDNDYEFRVRLINEDLLPGPWSNIVSSTTSNLSTSGISNSKDLVLHLDFEDKADIFKDTSGKDNSPTGGNPSDYTTNSLFGDLSYYCDSGVASIEIDSNDFLLNSKPPYTSFMFEGTFKVLETAAASSDMALFYGLNAAGLSIRVDSLGNYIDSVRFQYGPSTLIQFQLDSPDLREYWPLGETKHITAVFDASGDEFKARLFIDGTLIAEDTEPYSAPLASGAIGIFGSNGSLGYYGTADEIKIWKLVSYNSPDDSDSHIRATIPAPGVFNTGNTYPRIELNSQTSSGGTNPVARSYNSSGEVFLEFTGSGLLLDPDNAVDGYVLTTDTDGNATWQESTGGGISSGVYNTLLSTGLAMPEDVGGLTAGTTVDDLKGDTFISLFDSLLFPTVEAYIDSAAGAALTGYTAATTEVGTSWDPGTLTATLDRGSITNGDETAGPDLIGQGTEFRYYDPSGGLAYTYNLALQTTWDYNVPAFTLLPGNNYWSVEIDHQAGTGTYTDNKGVSASNLDSYRVSGMQVDNAPTIYARYKYWYGYGAQSSAPTTSVDVRALSGTGFLSASNTGDFSISIPASTPEVYFYTYSGQTVTVTYVESSNADVTDSFTKTGFQVKDAGISDVNYESFVSYIGAAGYPSTATYNVSIT